MHKVSKPKPVEPLDDWILSRLHSTIQVVTDSMEAYNPTLATRILEYFVVEDLSKWWVRRSRERFSGRTADSELSGTTALLRYLLIEVSKLLAPFMPFTADHIYKRVNNRVESVHLEDWPLLRRGYAGQAKYIDTELEVNMAKIREIVTAGLALRKAASLKVRQPLASLSVKEKIPQELARYIEDEVNVKEILFAPSQEESVTLDTELTEALKIEGYTREVYRAIQEMRKDAGYQMSDKVFVYWESTSPQVKEAVAMLKDVQTKEGKVFDMQKEFDLAPGMKIWLGIKR